MLAVFIVVLFVVIVAGHPLLEPRDLDIDTYSRWHSLNVVEKLPYIFETREIAHFEYEFNLVAEEEASVIRYAKLLEHLQEFQSEEDIQEFFKSCDENNNEEIDFIEYVVCRCNFDANGYQNEESELDLLEDVVLNDFVEKFIESVDSPFLEYDAEGFIIDR